MTEQQASPDPMYDLDAQLESLCWQDLVSEKETQRLAVAFSEQCGQPVHITPAKPEAERSVPVTHQLEVLAYVSGDLPETRLRSFAVILERVLYQAARYYMAANLHLDVVKRDYEVLQAKHEALQVSEARYRKLSAQLEAQVAEQVAQIEDRQRRLYAAEKLNAVGRLGAGVAHEINNPIGFIQSNLNSSRAYIEVFRKLTERLRQIPEGAELIEELELDYTVEDFAELTAESLDGARRVSGIVAALRRFTGTDDTGPQLLSLNRLLEEVWAVAAPELGEASVAWALDESIPSLQLDRAAISQAFYNVLDNCAKSSLGKVRVEIKTASADAGVRVDITDNGQGMGEETLSHMFDPFYTTRPVGAGTGLGLTVCRDTVIAHNGSIRAVSKPGVGTRVRVWLPSASTHSDSG